MRGIREVIKGKDSIQLEKYIDIDARGLLKGVTEIKLVKFSVNCT